MVSSPNKHARINSADASADEENLNPMFVNTEGIPMIKVFNSSRMTP
jgi:hypothetical protein